MRTEIIYEDKDILVIYKPAGLATQTAKLGQADVVSELKSYLARAQKVGRDTYLGIIHRLDQPVEGLLIFAKHKKAAADLTAQLQRQGEGGNLHKHYYAVVCGKVAEQQGRLVDYMYKSSENLAVIVEGYRDSEAHSSEVLPDKDKTGVVGKNSAAMPEPKKAELEYRILKEKNFAGKSMGGIYANPSEEGTIQIALADIHILTGRFHQIRAQMAHGRMPLLGDAKYGSTEAKEWARTLGVQTVALCAYSLEFRHPATGKLMRFEERPRGKAFGLFL